MEKKIQNFDNSGGRNILIKGFVFAAGVAAGLIIAALAVWLLMPKMMLSVHESRFDSIEETVQRLKASIEGNNWQCNAIRNMNESMVKQNVSMEKQIRIVELCNAKYAHDILTTNPEVSTLMPCAWGVYQGNDGKVYISGMNMGLMGKMFGGNIAKVMGASVSKDENMILKDIIRE